MISREGSLTSVHWCVVCCAAKKAYGKGTKALNLVFSETGEVWQQFFSDCFDDQVLIRQVNILNRLLSYRIKALFIDDATPKRIKKYKEDIGVDFVLQVSSVTPNPVLLLLLELLKSRTRHPEQEIKLCWVRVALVCTVQDVFHITRDFRNAWNNKSGLFAEAMSRLKKCCWQYPPSLSEQEDYEIRKRSDHQFSRTLNPLAAGLRVLMCNMLLMFRLLRIGNVPALGGFIEIDGQQHCIKELSLEVCSDLSVSLFPP